MFDVDEFLADCVAATSETEPRRAIRDTLERAVSRPDDVAAALQPTEGGITLLHHAPDLTVIHLVWAPGMYLYPHDHRMWAAIGIYAGQEDNAFFRRTGAGEHAITGSGGITESGGKELVTGDVLLLGDDTIHAVSNPTDRNTAAIHVYGGDFVNQPRSQWGPGPREERPYDMNDLEQQFVEANRAATAGSPEG